MAEALNALIAQIDYLASSSDYLYLAPGVNSPTALMEATTLLGFNKFTSGLNKRASLYKLAVNQTEAQQPSFPMVANLRLKAFSMFLEWQVLMDKNINDTNDTKAFDEAQIWCWRDRIVFLEEKALSTDNSWNFTHDDVPKLDGFNKWYRWLEAMETALQHKQMPKMGILMSYLIRKEATAISWEDIKDDNPWYEDLDTLLIQSVQLHGPVFKCHNQLFFDNLKSLTTGGDCW